jgi:flagella basal body P-ring formation protein FlgA
MLELPPLVHRGERVKLVAKNEILKVSTLGIAKSQGGKGERVKVVNISSQKTVVGVVTDASTVEVTF